MQRATLVTTTVILFGLFVSVAGCSREQVVAPPTDKASRERTKLFTQLTAAPDSGVLKAHFQTKFPDLNFRVWGSGAMPVRPGPSDPSKVHLEIQLIVSRSSENSQNVEVAQPRLLSELEEYFNALARSTGVEIMGPIKEASKDGKKVGFRFEYRTADNSGSVTVGPQEKVAGGFLVVIEEWE